MIRVLFNLEMEYHLSSMEPLYRCLENDPEFDVWIKPGSDPKKILGLFYSSRKKKIKSRLLQKNYKVSSKTRNFDVVITGDTLENPDQYGNAIFVHIDHGVGIKTSRIRNIVKQKKYRYQVFLEGQYWYDYIKSLGWQDKADFHITGLPKLDPFFQPHYFNTSEIISSIQLDPDKKTVLFAPSYKPSCIEFIEDKIFKLSPKYNLIIKLHPYSWHGRYAPRSHYRIYKKAVETRSNVHLINEQNHDIQPYLFIADTLISDTSSVINEFLALGRFGIIYELPHYKEKHSDGMNVLSIDPAQWLKGAFPHINSPESIEAAVQKALHPNDDMIGKHKYYRDYFFTGLDGKSSWRISSSIKKLVKGKINAREI